MSAHSMKATDEKLTAASHDIIAQIPEPPSLSDSQSAAPETKLPIRGSVRVLCEIRNIEAEFGDQPFSVDRSMIAHWAKLIEAELADDIKVRLPDLQKHLAKLERAKKVSGDTLNLRMDT